MKKINLTRVFINGLPPEKWLDFGTIKNVRLTNIFNGDKLVGDTSERRPRNCYMTFSQVDDDNKIIAQSIFDYFDINNELYAKSNFVHQMIQLSELITYTLPVKKVAEAIKEYESFINTHTKELEVIFDSKSDIKKGDLGMIKKLMNKINKKAEKLISPYYFTGNKIQLMVVCDKSGKYLNLPSRESKGFVAHMTDSELIVPAKYVSWRLNKDVPEVSQPDSIGESDDIVDDILPDIQDPAEMLI